MKEEKKTGAARTQPATRNEEWSDERLSEFLGLQPPASMPADYAVLLKAYRGMTADLFARFVPLFVAAGRDVNATLDNGSTILDHLRGTGAVTSMWRHWKLPARGGDAAEL